MTAADRKRVHRAIAGALAEVDALWSRRELDALIERNGERTPEILRELIINALGADLHLGLHPGAFESLLDAVRMTA